MLAEELKRSGMNGDVATIRLGSIVSLGVVAYAVGKFLLAGLGDIASLAFPSTTGGMEYFLRWRWLARHRREPPACYLCTRQDKKEKDKNMTTVADEVTAIFAKKGQSAYFGEAVSQLEHALQAAYCAQEAGASDALIVAALLHDVGHLLDETPENIADLGVDAKHEELGHAWLAARFDRDVFEPAYLHVSAKRYLCATDPSYLGKLSAASVQSLELQGGPMTAAEVAAFESNQYYREAVALRRWDDQAKIVDLQTPPLASYGEMINSEASASRSSKD
jgi:phosphonate degradation associated HDIG domain protein